MFDDSLVESEKDIAVLLVTKIRPHYRKRDLCN